MTFSQFAALRRYGDQPSAKRRLFRRVWLFAALAAAPTLATASSPDEEMAQMRAECDRLHEEMGAMAKDGADAMDESSLSEDQRRMHRMCMSMPHDSDADGQREDES